MPGATSTPVRRKGLKLSSIHAGKRRYAKACPPDLQLSQLSSEDTLAALLTPSSSADTLPEHTSPTSPKFNCSYTSIRSLAYLLSRDSVQTTNSCAFWVVIWFFLNFSLTLSNKVILNRFPFPYSITALHALGGCLGTWSVLRSEDRLPTLSSKEIIVLVSFSTLYTLNIVVSNVSLQLVTVPFHQVVRSSAPFFTLILSALLIHSSITLSKLISLIPVVAGVGLATYGDYYYTLSGFLLTLLGTILAALKTVVTNILQFPHNSRSRSQRSTSTLLQAHEDNNTSVSHLQYPRIQTSGKGHEKSPSISITFSFPPPSVTSRPTNTFSSIPKLHLTPIQLLHLLSPLALFQCMLLAIYFNEHTKLLAYFSYYHTASSAPDSILGGFGTSAGTGAGGIDPSRSMIPDVFGLTINVFMAFALNVVSFHTNRTIGALGMSVAANVKQVLTILSSIFFFNLTITRMNALGIFLTLIGGGLYASIDLRERGLRSSSPPR